MLHLLPRKGAKIDIVTHLARFSARASELGLHKAAISPTNAHAPLSRETEAFAAKQYLTGLFPTCITQRGRYTIFIIFSSGTPSDVSVSREETVHKTAFSAPRSITSAKRRISSLEVLRISRRRATRSS